MRSLLSCVIKTVQYSECVPRERHHTVDARRKRLLEWQLLALEIRRTPAALVCAMLLARHRPRLHIAPCERDDPQVDLVQANFDVRKS